MLQVPVSLLPTDPVTALGAKGIISHNVVLQLQQETAMLIKDGEYAEALTVVTSSS